MITQKFKSGKNEIRVENAESMDDAKKNGFIDGNFSRFFVNNKPVANYMALLKFIVDETKRTGQRFIPPSKAELKKKQKEALQNQNNSMRDQLNKIKQQYKSTGAPEQVIKYLDESIEKIDLAGVRVIE